MSHAHPKFDECSAPVRSLDDWKSHHHIKGEPVCSYLRECAKQSGEFPLTGDKPAELTEKVCNARDCFVACSLFGDIRRQLARAALSPSKHNTGIGLRKC